MERKERERNHIDTEIIKENVSKTKYPDDIKKILLCFSLKINDLLFEKGISQEEFSNMTKIGQTSISKYRNGTALPKQENIDVIAKALDVSSEYLVGKSETKDYSYKQLNKIFGFNDETINNFAFLKNKEILNIIFNNDDIFINNWLEKIKLYKEYKLSLLSLETKYNDEEKIDRNSEYHKEYFDLITKIQNTGIEIYTTLLYLIDNNLK